MALEDFIKVYFWYVCVCAVSDTVRTGSRILESYTGRKKIIHYPVDTRISDRIRHRSIPSVDICEMFRSNDASRSVHNGTGSDTFTEKYSASKMILSDRLNSAEDNTNKDAENSKVDYEIPTKPFISIRLSKEAERMSSVPRLSGGTASLNKVLHFDYENKFIKEQSSKEINVEKIQESSIQVIIDSDSEPERKKALNKFDNDSEVRGKQALKKEKVRKDYTDLLQKLSMLQKQERVLNIFSDKPEHHMSEDRLRKLDEGRQNCIENAYEKFFPPPPKRAIVTLPPKTEFELERNPHKVVTAAENPVTLNVATWDINSKQGAKVGFNPTNLNTTGVKSEKPDTIHQYNNMQHEMQLKYLLESLKAQKETLLKEIQLLSDNGNLNELVDQYNSITSQRDQSANKIEGNNNISSILDKTRVSDDANANNANAYRSNVTRIKHSEKIKSEEHLKKCHSRSASSSGSSSPSPRKKPKLKIKKQFLILQNTSTQTTPKKDDKNQENIQNTSSQTSPKKIEGNRENVPGGHKESALPLKCESRNLELKNSTSKTVCVCKSDNIKHDKLCEIVIKIHENKPETEININSAKNASKQETESTENNNLQSQSQEETVLCKSKLKPQISLKAKYGKQKSSFTVKQKDQIFKKTKRTTWQAQLSQNFSPLTSSSTSYYSPPDIKKNKSSHLPSHSRNLLTHLNDALSKKPQQYNISGEYSHENSSDLLMSKTKIDSFVVKYIEKLLTMSEGSVDELEISSVSDIPTPSQSVVEVVSNHPIAQLYDLMTSFDISIADIQNYFKSISNYSHMYHKMFNTSSGVSRTSSDSAYQINDHHTALTSCTDSTTKNGNDIREMSLEDYSKQCYPNMMSKYAEVAKSCNERITSLTAMIEKVRLEKKRMMQSRSSSESDKENSTSYLDLPKDIAKKSLINCKSPDSANNSTKEQEELNRELLDIDLSLAAKLKTLTPSEVRAQHFLNGKVSHALSQNSSRQAASISGLSDISHNMVTDDSAVKELEEKSRDFNTDFIPLLLDIPKLPKLSVPNELQYEIHKNKKPPPSKGLTVVRKFNGDILTVPHELSTIVEADTHTSSKYQKVSSSDTSSSLGSNIVSLRTNQMPQQSNKSKKSTEESVPDILSEVVQNQNEHHESTSKVSTKGHKRILVHKASEGKGMHLSSDSSTEKSNDIETVETMLQEIGMAWAVTTLRKTQEALALTSSSSSLDISIKQKEVKLTDSGSSSELSVRDLIGKQFLAKLTSNLTNSSDNSLSSLMKEFQDISAIQGSSSTTNHEKTNQRTSTPVHINKDKCE